MQQAFHEHHGLQCGYCTAGMVMAAVSLLDEIPNPTERDVRARPRGQPLPLHRLPQHREVGARRGRADAGDQVIPAAFDYVRAESADDAIALLAEHGDDAKFLAGGMSLLPLMKLRLATPTVLVDVGRVRDLSYVRDAGDHVAIGALTRHRDLETERRARAASAACCARSPRRSATTRCATAARSAVRSRTAIPASDLPAALLALDATFVAAGAGRRRATIAASDFFQGFLETALAPDELLTEIRVPQDRRRTASRSRSSTGGPRTGRSSAWSRRDVNGATHVGLDQHGLHAAARDRGRDGARAGRVGGRRRRAGRRRHRAAAPT